MTRTPPAARPFAAPRPAARPAPVAALRLLRGLLVGLAAVALLLGPLSRPAAAEGTASTVDVEAVLSADGSLSVRQTVVFSGAAPQEVTQRFETRQDVLGDRQYVQRIESVSVDAGGNAVAPTVSVTDRYTTVTFAPGGASQIVLGYTVRGAVVPTDEGTALRFALLQGLSLTVERFDATVQIPGAFSYVRCTAGAPNAGTPCRLSAAGTEQARTPTFADGPRGEGEVVAVDIGFPPGTVAADVVVDRRWTVAHAFAAQPLPLALALALLVLGGTGLVVLHRRAGRDVAPAGPLNRVAEFAPVEDGRIEFRVVDEIRPGHVGTVGDERVDPVDVTATLLDLAVRGHLLITELPRASAYGRSDWELTRRTGPDALRPFETRLLDGLAPAGGAVRVSELAGKVHETIGAVQDELYSEVVRLGWFERRPDATRTRWSQLAFAGLAVGVLVTVVLALFTSFGLVGLALILLALGLVYVAQEMPSRTARGSALLAGLLSLRSDLHSQPTHQMPRGRELQEISEVLPYAVVLGGVERWLDALVAADDDAAADPTDLDWYHGPDDWHLADLPDSLHRFITQVSGLLYAR